MVSDEDEEVEDFFRRGVVEEVVVVFVVVVVVIEEEEEEEEVVDFLFLCGGPEPAPPPPPPDDEEDNFDDVDDVTVVEFFLFCFLAGTDPSFSSSSLLMYRKCASSPTCPIQMVLPFNSLMTFGSTPAEAKDLLPLPCPPTLSSGTTNLTVRAAPYIFSPFDCPVSAVFTFFPFPPFFVLVLVVFLPSFPQPLLMLPKL